MIVCISDSHFPEKSLTLSNEPLYFGYLNGSRSASETAFFNFHFVFTVKKILLITFFFLGKNKAGNEISSLIILLTTFLFRYFFFLSKGLAL